MTPPHAPTPHELVALRQRYRLERERRVRPDGLAQYRDTDAEFGYYAADPYTSPTERAARRDTVDVAVIGGGFGGILAGARLRQQGVGSIRIVERGGDVGGTWYWNRYPGVHCDIESHVYLPLLDETGYVPEWKYAPGEEIRQHAVRIAERFGLYADALFSTQVTSLTWDEAGETWTVTTDRGDAFRAAYVVNATGTLTEPKLPGIPGIETFRGHTHPHPRRAGRPRRRPRRSGRGRERPRRAVTGGRGRLEHRHRQGRPRPRVVPRRVHPRLLQP